MKSYRISPKGMIIRFFYRRNTVSAVRKYGDEAVFDASASFLSLPASVDYSASV